MKMFLLATVALLTGTAASAQVAQTYNCGTPGTPACPTLQQRTDAARPAPNTQRYGERSESQTNQSGVNNSDRSSGKSTGGSKVSPQ